MGKSKRNHVTAAHVSSGNRAAMRRDGLRPSRWRPAAGPVREPWQRKRAPPEDRSQSGLTGQALVESLRETRVDGGWEGRRGKTPAVLGRRFCREGC